MRTRTAPPLPVLALLAGLLPATLGAVTINEIHFDPPQGSELEFVELHNPSLNGLSLEGWSFSAGLSFTFPPGATIPGHGYVVVARNPALLMGEFGLQGESQWVFGPYESNLDNGGEELALEDASGAIADAVDYDDEPPWDLGADGEGGSLERICHQADSQLSSNWRADPVRGPTPLRANGRVMCPPPAPPAPPLILSEIHYHPTNDADLTQEFIEIQNATDAAFDLTGYALSQGVQFKFAPGTAIAPRGFLVVCRNLSAARDALGIVGEAVGNFEGQLDNGGERLALVDPRGAIVDSVRYSDDGDWPVAPDGLGRSLERISPASPGDDPASWTSSSIADSGRWRTAAVSGPATSSVLYVYIMGKGEFLIDDVTIEDPQNPGANLIANGSFDAGMDGWTPAGNHLDTIWEPASGLEGGGGLRVVANGRGTGAGNGIARNIDPPLTRNAIYRFSLRYRYLSGDPGLLVRVNGASAVRGLYIDARSRPIITAGEANSTSRAVVPPFISHLGRSPREPRSTDPVVVTARVRGNGVLGVYLDYWLNFKPEMVDALEMLDDGLHGDGEAGDGIRGARLPPFPHNTAVTFRINAEDSTGGSRELPAAGDPTGVLGFYVNDDQPQSPLPVFHMLIDHLSVQNPMNITRALSCDVYRGGAFAYEGELYPGMGFRQRGQSVCNSQKPFLKARFNRGRDFQGRHKINLQSLWTDKSLVREHLAWNFFGEMDNPTCTDRFVRVHMNGKYYGLHTELEHPDADYLDRNGLNPQGNLYKAVASREERMPSYQAGYEKKTNEDGDFSDLKTFLDTMNSIPRTQLRAFWERNVVEDSVIDYQAAQVLPNNRDYVHKNHYLYHDTADGRWRTLTWDMDLTFGKIWDGTNGGVLNDAMDSPGITPWYGTRVAGEGIGNYLTDRFFFDTPDRWYQRALRVRLWIALREKYTPDLFDRKIFGLRDFLMGEQAEDIAKWSRSAPTANDRNAPRDFLPNLERVRSHIKTRQTYLNNYLRNTDRLPAPDRLKITEVMYHPPGRGEQLEFIELLNVSGKEINVAGWTVGGIEYRFPEGSAIPAGEVLVVARSPDVFAARYGEGIRTFGPYEGDLDNRGEEIRVRDAGPAYPATIDVVRYRNERPWPTKADELGHSIELTEVHDDRDNDPAESWRASALPGGSPGRIPGLIRGVPFRRGNCNGDDKVSLSDAIALLGMFFYDFPTPRCLDGCDANGDKGLDISDAVVILRYLFLNDDLIPEPGPRSCGVSEGSFCEESNCPAPPPP